MKIKFSLKAFLLAFAVLALTGLAFSSTKAYAKTDSVAAAKSNDYTWSYDASQDAIVFKTESATGVALKIVNGKDKDTKSASKADKTVTVKAGTGTAFAIGDKKTGINQAVTKDLYLFATSNNITKGEYTCDIKVNKTTVGNIRLTVKYTVMGASDQVALTGEKAPADDKKSFATADIKDFQFAEYNKSSKSYTQDGWQDADKFTGDLLEKYLARALKKEKFEIHVRYKGTDAANNATTGVRPSKIVKLKLAKQGKLAVVKFDYKKNAIALKNGYDFFVTSSTGASINYNDWQTILPYNKKTENKDKIIDVTDYNPSKFNKDDDTQNKNAWTNVQVKTVALTDTDVFTDMTKDAYLYYRKSATAGKPAAAYSTGVAFCIKAQADAPAVASGASFATGKSITLAPIAKNDNDECASSALEYAIVLKADLGKIDDSSIAWKALKSTTKFKADTKKTSKYMKTTDEKAAAQAAADLSECVVLVRRSAPKVTTNKTGITTIWGASKILKVEFEVAENVAKVAKATDIY